MKLTCPECQAIYSIDDALISDAGVKAQCPACGKVQVVRPASSAQFSGPPLPQEPPTLPGAKSVDQPAQRPAQITREPPRLPDTQSLAPAPSQEIAPDRCERCGGVIAPGTGIGGKCERCRSIEQESAIRPGDREWRVQKSDGVILGPLTLDEVKTKFQQGEVAATDRVARGEGDFRLISSFAEFSDFFRRPSEAFKMTFRHPPPSHRGRNIAILVVMIVVLGGMGGWYLYSRMSGGPEVIEEDLREMVLERFSQEVPTPTGSPAEAVATGRKFMLLDDRLSYMQADLAFKSALLLDPDNTEACAGWVQNRALMDRRRGDVAARKTALDLVDYFLARHPENPLLHRAKAFLLFSLGSNEEARKHAKKVEEKLAGDPENQLVMGATYLESSTDMAVSMIKQALDSNAELNIAFRLLGEAAVRQGKFHKALQYLQKRLEKDPGEFEALDASAKVYQEVGRFEKAADTYEIILAAAPHRPEAIVSLARLHTQVFHNPKKALSVLEGALQHSEKIPAEARARMLAEQAIAFRLLGNAKGAATSADSAVEADSMCIPALYARAVVQHEAGRLESGLGQLRSLQVHLPHSARLRARIAEMEMLIPNYQKAQENLKRAVEMDQNDLEIHLIMAVFHGYLDSPTQAYAWLQKSMAIDPFFDEVHARITAFYDGPGFLKGWVQRALQTAAKYDEDPLIQALCGIVLFRAGQPEQAKSRLQKAIGLDAECFQANLYQGVVALSQKKASVAVGFLEQAHKIDGLHAMATKLLARAYLQQGKLKQASELFGNVLTSSPGDLEARLGLGEVYMKAKKKSKAVRELLKVYQSDEHNLLAKTMLFQLGY